MKFQPLGSRILIRPAELMTTTAGGILIPSTAQERPMEGTVIASGPGVYEKGVFVPNTVKQGDRVIYGKWSGSEIVVDGEKLIIMTESEILGVMAS